MNLSRKVISCFLLALFLMSTNLELFAATAKPDLSELEVTQSQNAKIRLFAYLDDLNQDYNNITNGFAELRLVVRTKGKRKKSKYLVYEVNGSSRVLLSTVDSKKKTNALPLGSFDNLDLKDIEIEVQDNKGNVNIYKAIVRMANAPTTTVNPQENQTNVGLFTSCFAADSLVSYEDCLELFFRRVSFEQDNESATVANQDGNFVVTLPTVGTASAGATGATGARGPAGLPGANGRDGDGYWQLLGNNLINNGELSDIKLNNFIFGDTSIEADGENKIAFEKATGALRIGSTLNGEWTRRGDHSMVVGFNSSAQENGGVSLGNYNTNISKHSFILGEMNNVLDSNSVGKFFNKQKSYTLGYMNTDEGGASYTVGAGNTNHTRNSVIVGNSNSVASVITNSEKPDETNTSTNSIDSEISKIFKSGYNNVFGSENSIGHRSKRYSRASTDSTGKTVYTASLNSSFISGKSNTTRYSGQNIHGNHNRIRSNTTAEIHGSGNNIYDYTRRRNPKSVSKYFIVGKHNRMTGYSDRETSVIGNNNYTAGISSRSLLLGSRNTINCGSSSDGERDCGDNHTLIGNNNIAGTRRYSSGNTNSADRALAIGDSNRVTEEDGIAMGRFTLASARESMVIGSGNYSGPLTNNKANTLAIGVNATVPTITVTSPSYNERATGTGNVAIGNVEPVRKLHISEAMRIEPQEHAPFNPSLGDIYTDDSGAVCVYASGSWTKIAGAGTCSEVLQITSESPWHGNNNANPGDNISFYISESNIEKGTGFIKVYKSDDNSLVESIEVNTSSVVVSGNMVAITLAEDLELNTQYYVSIDEGFVRQIGTLKPNPALDGKTSWEFTVTDGFIATQPNFPFHRSTNINVDTTLGIWFDRGVTKESGFISIYKASDDSLVESVEVNSTAVTSNAGNTLTVALSSNLDHATEYYVNVDEAIVSSSFEVNPAIDGKTQWSFTTRAADPE